MSRKKYNPRKNLSYKGEQSPFAKRLSMLIETRGLKQREVADALDVQRQTVSLYTKGQALPDISTLTKITELFNVSADYLLGITDAPTVDVKRRAICDYIGFSETAVFKLRKMKLERAEYTKTKIFSDTIDSKSFDKLIERLQQFISEKIEHHEDMYYRHSMEESLPSTLTQTEAELYAAAIGKRLISADDLSHFYRKLSVELFENIILDLSDDYTAFEVNKPADLPDDFFDEVES